MATFPPQPEFTNYFVCLFFAAIIISDSYLLLIILRLYRRNPAISGETSMVSEALSCFHEICYRRLCQYVWGWRKIGKGSLLIKFWMYAILILLNCHYYWKVVDDSRCTTSGKYWGWNGGAQTIALKDFSDGRVLFSKLLYSCSH